MHIGKKFLLFALTVVCFTTSVSCGEEESDGKNYSFNYAFEGNPQNLDPQLATDSASLTVIENTFQGLTDIDEDGFLTYGVAEKCDISQDCLTYTFTLRDDCYWYDGKNNAYPVTAEDFVFAFQRIFNPVTCSPYRETFSCIENAEKIINGSLDYTKIGVYAPDKSTIVFKLDYPDPCFMEMLSSAPAMPCNQKFFESTKARYGLDEESVISNGSFYIQQWFYDEYGNDNFLYLRRNSSNNQNGKVLPYSINFVIEKDNEDISENFKTGDYDCLKTYSQAEYKGIISNFFETDEYSDRTIGLIFNPAKITDDNLKNALCLSVDREKYGNKLVSSCEVAYGIIPPCMKTGNNFYRDLTDEKLLVYYDIENAIKMAEKSEIRKLLILTTEAYAEKVYIDEIASFWSDKLGIEVIVEETDYEEYQRRISAGEYDMAVCELSADYDNPYDILEKFISDNNSFGYSDSETDNLLKQSQTINGSEKRCELYFSAEKRIIENCGFIPLYYKKTYFISANNSDDIIFNPFTDEINFRYARNYS